MYIDLHVKYPLFLSNFKETYIFSTHMAHLQGVGGQMKKAVLIRGQFNISVVISTFRLTI